MLQGRIVLSLFERGIQNPYSKYTSGTFKILKPQTKWRAHLRTRMSVSSSLLTFWYAGRESIASYQAFRLGVVGPPRSCTPLCIGRYTAKRSRPGAEAQSASPNSLHDNTLFYDWTCLAWKMMAMGKMFSLTPLTITKAVRLSDCFSLSLKPVTVLYSVC